MAFLRADQPTDKDELNVGTYAEALAEFIAQCQTPMAVGIQGPWGSGKSSLMQMVQAELARPKQHTWPGWLGRKPRGSTDDWQPLQVFFETWQFGVLDPEGLGFRFIEHLVASLEAELTARLGEGGKSSAALRLCKTIRASLPVLKQVAIAGVSAVLHGATGGVADGSSLAAGLREISGSGAPISLDQVIVRQRDQFAQLIEAACRELHKTRVVIYVDDLDRVRPIHAVSMLEFLKNFVDVPGCVFVLACDYEVVRAGVAAKFDIRSEAKAQAFFDKIVQVPFDVPVESYAMDGLFNVFLQEKQAASAFKKRGADTEIKRLNALLSLAVGKNPRAFKRFVNRLDLLAIVVSKQDRERSDVWSHQPTWMALATLAGCQVRWRHVTAWLTDHVETPQDFSERLNELLTPWEDPDFFEDPNPHLLALFRRELKEIDASVEDDESLVDHPLISRLHEFARALRRVRADDLARVARHLSVTSTASEQPVDTRDTYYAALEACGRSSFIGFVSRVHGVGLDVGTKHAMPVFHAHEFYLSMTNASGSRRKTFSLSVEGTVDVLHPSCLSPSHMGESPDAVERFEALLACAQAQGVAVATRRAKGNEYHCFHLAGMAHASAQPAQDCIVEYLHAVAAAVIAAKASG